MLLLGHLVRAIWHAVAHVAPGVSHLVGHGVPVVGSLAAGLVGWILVASGAGKLTAWREFRSGIAQGGLVPRALVVVPAILIPPAEFAAGVLAIAHPEPRVLAAAGCLFLLFAVYQSELLQRGSEADCHCYGRLRHVPPTPGVVVANALLAFCGLALAFHAAPMSHAAVRVVGGAALAACYLFGFGRQRPTQSFSGYPYAELRYVERRLAGDGDLVAREAVAKEFSLPVRSTYLMLPRYKTWWLVLRARIRGTAAPFP